MGVLDVLGFVSLGVGCAVALPITGYLGFLALAAWRAAPPLSTPGTRFVVVVPAHNEEGEIARTVESVRAVDYPAHLFEVVVVADNCSDQTATRARAAGATVLERQNDTLRGKGYALEHAFAEILPRTDVDAVVVVDADTLVTPNLLRAFAARLAMGERAVQAEYGVRNVDASWRTRLMTVALAMFHGVRSLARERLGVSAGLRGNGMCFARSLLLEVPHRAFGLVEDVEYGIAIGRHGVRVAYAAEAEVKGEMVSSGKAAESQRRRWEGGRVALLRAEVPGLIRDGLKQRSGLLLDLAADLLIPPLSYVGILVGFGLVLELTHTFWVGAPGAGTWVWGLSLVFLLTYILRGVALSGLGLGGLLVLAWAPVYVAWKVVRVRPWSGSDAWIRTRREAETGTGDGDDEGDRA